MLNLFGKGRYQYTFRNGCDEFPGLKLEDGATTILLNTHGTDSTGVSEEMIALLHYFEDTSEKVAEDSGSRRIIIFIVCMLDWLLQEGGKCKKLKNARFFYKSYWRSGIRFAATVVFAVLSLCQALS